ncbi:MAG: hypothetical protein NTY17_08250 [Planctomycetia bacterium]|nr:hypothetical protein [Planctomycetia bacterium]
MNPRLLCCILPLAILFTPAILTSAAEPAAREPAADGTVSVVAAPPAAGRGDPADASVATDVLSTALEPLEAGLRGDPGGGTAPASPRSASTSLATAYARPLPLVEALERSGDRTRRLWISQAYWKVSAGFAMLRWSTEALERLELIAPGGDPHDRAVLDVALAAARADLADSRAELVAAQQELVDLVRLPAGDPLPWPVDRPLAGPYQTHFETIFATRPATGRIRAIVRMLPSKHEALEARAAAVVAAQKAMQMAETDHAKGQRPIEAVTAAHAAVTSQQREFVKVMRAYNLDIAEYAMNVADLSVPDDRFVSMLIGAPIQWRPQPAAAPQQAAPAPPSPVPAAN